MLTYGFVFDLMIESRYEAKEFQTLKGQGTQIVSFTIVYQMNVVNRI